VLACDIVGRLIRYPYEIPISVVMGVVGSLLFLYLLLRTPRGAK
jgi:iron complex transport system permease protein